VEVRFESQNLEIFDLAAEELYRHLPATISHTLELSNTLAKNQNQEMLSKLNQVV
jgi:LPS sulfotransferase NodH